MPHKLILSLLISLGFIFSLVISSPVPAVAAVPPTAAELSALLTSCTSVTGSGKFALDDGDPDTVSMCQLTGGIYWKADMDIDCDGIETAQCNSSTDSSYQPMTSATDSSDNYLNAATLPFVVIPMIQSRFDYSAHGIQLGSVVAVIYGGQVQYGVFGDEAGGNFIGEASYAMANLLGIDPNPETGGTAGPVSYIVFTGSSGVASPIENHSAAVTVGQNRACQLINDNGGTCGASPSPSPLPSSSPAITPAPSPLTSSASTPPTSAYPDVPITISFDDVSSFNAPANIIDDVINWLIGIISSIFILLIVIGGVMYMSAFGDEERMAQAKKVVTYAIIGLFLVLVSYSVLSALSDIIFK